MAERRLKKTIRPSYLNVRKQRIERWAFPNRTKANLCTTTLGAALVEKRSESALFQDDRRLRMELYRLGEEREKLLERFNFDQKLFANKQAIKHKDNSEFVSTLNYVRKCCKYSNQNDFQNEKKTDENRTQSLTTKTILDVPKIEVSLVESDDEDKNDDKRHVQFDTQNKRASQSAHVASRARSLIDSQHVQLSNQTRSINSAPPSTSIFWKSSTKSQRPSSRIFATKSTLEEFRRHPERFLSQTNRYLPLLRRQAVDIQIHDQSLKQKQNNNNNNKKRLQSISHLSDTSDFITDDIKSFLSDEIISHLPAWDNHERRQTTPLRAPSRINLLETNEDNTSEQKLIFSRLREREYANLQTLIQSNSIQHILEPLSSMKESIDDQTTDLKTILRSIDSLGLLTKPKVKTNKFEQNHSQLGILSF